MIIFLIMKEKVIDYQQFCNFLKRNDCYYQYMLNFTEQFSDIKWYKGYIFLSLEDNNLSSPEKLFDFSPKFMIVWGFSWENTKEGSEFWNHIHIKWNNIFK